MKMKYTCPLVRLLVLALLAFTSIPTRSQTVVGFDDLSETASGSWLQSGYQGLNWNMVLVNNAILGTNSVWRGPTGDYYGMVSLSNVAVLFGNPSITGNSEIDSPGTNFNFLSAYFTGAFDSNLNIEVQGFNGTNLTYDQTVVTSATNPTLFTFNYLNIDRLYFNSSGGQPAFGFYNDTGEFIMDDFTFEFIPEPSSLLLTVLGVVSLWAFVKRRRL